MKMAPHYFVMLLLLGNPAPFFAQTATPNQIPELEQQLAAATAPAEQAALCNELAFAALKKDFDQALAYADRALAYARAVRDNRASLIAMNLRGDALVKKNELAAAEKAYNDALALLKTAPDRELEGRTRHNFGKLAQTRRDTTAAIRFYEQAFAIRQSIGDKKGMAATVNNLGVLYANSNVEKAVYYYEIALELKKEAGDRSGMAVTQANLAWSYAEMGKLERAQQLLDSAIAINRALDNKNSLAVCYQKAGAIQSRLGHFDAAIAAFEKAKTMFESLGDGISASMQENNLGQQYLNKGDYPKAMEHFLTVVHTPGVRQDVQFSAFKGMADVKGYQHFNQESLEYLEKALALAQMDAERANVLSSRAETESILGRFEKAEATAKAGLAFAKKSGVIHLHLACLLQLSNAHRHLGKLPEALAEVRETIALGKKAKSIILPSAYTLQSNILTAMGGENKVLALENAQKALELAQKQGSVEAVISANLALSEACKALGKTHEAVETLKRAEALKDSLYSSEKTRDIARMEKDADFEKEREKIRLEQARKDTAAALEIERQKTTKYLLFGGLLVLLALGGMGFYTFRKRQQLRVQQREAETRLRIARDLHDEVGSTLSAINILSQSSQQGLPPDENKTRLGNIGDKARAALESMSDIVWAVNPQNDSMQQIIQRMVGFASETLESAGITPHFLIDEAVEQLSLPLEKRKDFYLIFKEAVTNCAKHSRAQWAHIHLKKEGGYLVFELLDDGVGVSAEVSTTLGGNGLKNMAARATAIGAAFSMEKRAEKGVVVLLKLPLA